MNKNNESNKKDSAKILSFLKRKENKKYVRIGIVLFCISVFFSSINTLIMQSSGNFDVLILAFISIFYIIFFLMLLFFQIVIIYEIRDLSLFKIVILPIVLIYIASSYFLIQHYIATKADNWFFELTLAILLINFMAILGLYKLCEACDELFSKKHSKEDRDNRKHVLYVRWTLPAFIGIIYALFILFVIYPDVSNNGLTLQENSYLLAQIVMTAVLVLMTRFLIGPLLEEDYVEEESWKKAVKLVFFPVVSFGIYEVYSAITGGNVFLNIKISSIHHEVFVYGVIFVLSIAVYSLLTLLKQFLRGVLEYAYEKNK